MRNALALCAALVLQGCATHDYGNFAQQADVTTNTVMVNDSLSQLMHFFPPAKTRLVVQQDTSDRFGQSLLRALRQQGYAVQEQSESGSPLPRNSTPLAYVIDSPEGSNAYRLTLRVGKQSLTRAYAARPEGIYPAGLWTRKE